MLRAGMVAIVGRANVGKSSLMNAILEEKVSIVSPVCQTTRNMIRGVLTEPRGQLVFLDTPGLHKAPSDLGRVMNKVARKAIEGTDLVLLALDVSEPPHQEDEGWIRRLVREETPVLAVLNKIDLGSSHEQAFKMLWQEVEAAKAGAKPMEWLRISATNGQGVQELITRLFELAPVGPPLFPEDVLTDFPRKLAMADTIREKFFFRLRDELPHALAVFVDQIMEEEKGWQVQATVYVEKHSQKVIAIGHKGRLIRAVRRAAERELSELYQISVSVDLWVKVEKNWDRNFWLLKKFGYV